MKIKILEPHSIKKSDYIVSRGVLYFVTDVELDVVSMRQSSEIVSIPRFIEEIYHLPVN